ncbi:site-specific DNA-methyltransferase [Methanococcus voltae]|uniref:site-specific DNA-methyltransferase n=1 Tax=Methanococcus voltae TaxID=2188 RepID=UPI001AE6D8D6
MVKITESFKPKKLELITDDFKKINMKKLGDLFPEILTEIERDGEIIKTINVDKLKELVGDCASNDIEQYELIWAGKQKAKNMVNEQITKTLRPCIDDSVDFENSENLYIEGDNLDVLKVLLNSYASSIKMIYIDPPYNTGKDFIYKDNFKMSNKEYESTAGIIDEEGNKLVTNQKTNGYYHSKWLNMMYPRLDLARKLLRDDGVIFISIDDNEVDNLKKICDEIFGEENFVGKISRKQSSGSKNDTGTDRLIKNVDKLIIYSKGDFEFYPVLEKNNKKYTLYDNEGYYSLRALEMQGGDDSLDLRPNMGYSIYHNQENNDLIIKFDYSLTDEKIYQKPDQELVSKGYAIYRPRTRGSKAGIWRWGSEKFVNEFNNGNILFKENRVFQKERKKEFIEKFPDSLCLEFINTLGTSELKNLFDNKKIFDFPKPSSFIKKYIIHSCNKNDIILDFFSGSATTAHAVMQLNSEDNGNRKFIMVQLPEETDPKKEAYKAGYKNICEIGKERIRRAGNKIKEELKEKNSQTKDGKTINISELDFGFKVFKLDSSNMKDLYYPLNEVTQTKLMDYSDLLKEDRTEEDLLYQLMLDRGIPISAKVQINIINGKKVFNIDNGYLIACFDNSVDLELIEAIYNELPKTKGKPKFVFRESSFIDDSDMINVMEYLKTKIYKKTNELDTNVRVI